MKTKLTLLATLSMLSCAGHAADTAFYQISEITGNKAGNYGPWAVAMADDTSVASLAVTSDWFSYFNMPPSAMDLADRFRYMSSCSGQMSSDVCDGFWNGDANRAKQWRVDTVTYAPQAESIVNSTSQSEADGIIKALGATSNESVGYRIASTSQNGYYYERQAIATLDGTTIQLAPPATFDGIGGFSSANTIKKLDDEYVLVGGTVNTTVTAPESSLKNCYNGDIYTDGDYRYCPGFNTQAALWVVKRDGTATTVATAPAYYKHDKNVIELASVTGLQAESDGSYLAVGYSSTGEVGDSALYGRNVAVYWPVTVSSGTATFGDLKLIPLSKKAPGEGDEVLASTWSVAANSNYVIGNQKYSTVVSRNKPVEMFVYDRSAGTSTTPLHNKPFQGSNSEAMAINANNLIVGWRDERNETQAVYNGSPRMPEAFLYNAQTGSNWRLNDLICSGSSAALSCEQNGKYYYIAYANAIAEDGTIAATAYRYDSYADWSARNNATVVPVKLTPQVAFGSDHDVPADYVLANPLPSSNVGQDNGSGAVPLWMLLLLAPFGLLRVRKHFKKMS
ncbi:DUF3466 family protein [Pseudaeromonas sharmana]|uniref:DUF3466 family protein n=1 Tax=Pseudaeromonas sharmana TaxID=328412 RepID=A0ABV8CPB9_9GAMM